MNATQAAERAGLIDDVLAHPGDDAPRLVFADWCEDNGEPERAEFVRLQLEMAARAADGRRARECSWGGTCCCRSHKLERREAQILDGTPHFLRVGIPAAFSVEFRRGFVESVRCTLAAWQKHGPAVVRAHPVTRAALTDRRPYASPRPGGTDVHIYGWCDNDNGQAGTSHVGPWLFSLLPDEGRVEDPGTHFVFYASEALAQSAISEALLTLADPARLSRTA